MNQRNEPQELRGWPVGGLVRPSARGLCPMKQESMNHWSPESRDFSRGEVQRLLKENEQYKNKIMELEKEIEGYKKKLSLIITIFANFKEELGVAV
jgi:hypothetical protein